MMVGIDTNEFSDINDDLDFCKKILEEECVLIFPSKAFFAKDFFRIVKHFPEKLSIFIDYLYKQ